ncbi:MAG: tetratricopeptide repeat protein [Rhodoferax sp.]
MTTAAPAAAPAVTAAPAAQKPVPAVQKPVLAPVAVQVPAPKPVLRQAAPPPAVAPVPAATVAAATVAASAPATVLPLAEVKPAPRPAVNTQVQLSIEANAFDVREGFQNFVRLLQTGKLAEAQIAADRISSAMGRNHVMSLRAQGYLALKKGDLGLARGQYLELYQLLPEDREAGLNLALIEWRQGDKDAASKHVVRLLEKFPNDPEVQALHMNVRSP